MDTTQYIKTDENIWDEINNYLQGTSSELKIIIDSVEYTRYIQEIHQWFEIFQFSLNKLKNAVSLNSKSTEINTYLISLISSGKTLADSMESCVKLVYGESSHNYIDFKNNYLSHEYDHNFSYKFLLKLRNFSQHGHIPVSIINGQMRFDIMQIYGTPHYNHNASLKKDIDEFVSYVESKNPNTSDGPFLDLCFTVSSYVCSLYNIYKKYLDMMAIAISETWSSLINEINGDESLTVHPNADYRNMVFYNVTDAHPEYLQVINIKDDPTPMITRFKNQAVLSLKEERSLLKEMKKQLIPI